MFYCLTCFKPQDAPIAMCVTCSIKKERNQAIAKTIELEHTVDHLTVQLHQSKQDSINHQAEADAYKALAEKQHA